MPSSRNAVSYLIIFLILAFSYCNSLDAGWHFDDFPNIIWNNVLHLTDLSPSSILQTFFAYPLQQERFFRPISNFSFAINWFIGQDNVTGYHIFNIFIHFLNTVFLYKTILLLLSAPALKTRYSGKEQFIALLAATLWAVNPIHTQAITYIVQRMASLATLFYIIGLFFYLKGKLSNSKDKHHILYFFGCFIAYILAIGSKENTLVFPISLLLIEIIFFHFSLSINIKTITWLTLTFIIVIFIGLILTNGRPLSFLDTYQTRSFTIFERVLTESRVLLQYISQILYPIPSRLSLTHEIQLSTSLVNPITTLFSTLLLLLLTFWSIFKYKQFPLLSFAILFFLLNHVIESTVIPLELIFEHRNYLPSLFFFVPLAASAHLIIEYYKTKPIMRFFVISFFILLIISFSTGTLLRNQVWLTEESLWKDSVTKAPNTAKSYINLAHVYLNRGELEIAFELNKQALGKYSPTPWKNTLRSYHNMGNIMQDLRHYNDAIQYYDKALEEDPENIDVQYNKYLALQKNNSINEAFELINKLVDTNPENSTFLGALGKAYIMNGNNQLALHYFRLAMRNVSSNDTQKAIILLNIGTIYNNMENFDKAELYFDYGERVGASRLLLDLCSLEKCIRMENFAEAEIFFNSLLTNLTWPMLIQNLQKIQTWDFPVALNPIILKGYINKRVSELNSFPIYKN